MEIGARSPYPLLHPLQLHSTKMCLQVLHPHNSFSELVALFHTILLGKRHLISGWLTEDHMSDGAALPTSRCSWNVGWKFSSPRQLWVRLRCRAEGRDAAEQLVPFQHICQRWQAHASAGSSHSHLQDGSLKSSFKNMGISDYLLAVSLQKTTVFLGTIKYVSRMYSKSRLNF